MTLLLAEHSLEQLDFDFTTDILGKNSTRRTTIEAGQLAAKTKMAGCMSRP